MQHKTAFLGQSHTINHHHISATKASKESLPAYANVCRGAKVELQADKLVNASIIIFRGSDMAFRYQKK